MYCCGLCQVLCWCDLILVSDTCARQPPLIGAEVREAYSIYKVDTR